VWWAAQSCPNLSWYESRCALLSRSISTSDATRTVLKPQPEIAITPELAISVGARGSNLGKFVPKLENSLLTKTSLTVLQMLD
jgi:hypothetical protein